MERMRKAMTVLCAVWAAAGRVAFTRQLRCTCGRRLARQRGWCVCGRGFGPLPDYWHEATRSAGCRSEVSMR